MRTSKTLESKPNLTLGEGHNKRSIIKDGERVGQLVLRNGDWKLEEGRRRKNKFPYKEWIEIDEFLKELNGKTTRRR